MLDHVPGLFTSTMPAIVSPRKTSSEIKRPIEPAANSLGDKTTPVYWYPSLHPQLNNGAICCVKIPQTSHVNLKTPENQTGTLVAIETQQDGPVGRHSQDSQKRLTGPWCSPHNRDLSLFDTGFD
jgi:hypothetical protein